MPTDAPTTGAAGPVQATGDGVMVAVRLTPRAGRTEIKRPRRDPDGTWRLRVSVTAPPAENLANEALIALIAKTWKLPGSAMTIVAGARGREKRVLIGGDAGELTARIAEATGDEQ